MKVDSACGHRRPSSISALWSLVELNGYVPGWPRSVLDGHYDISARWFSDPEDPSGYGVGRLTNSVRGKDEALASALVRASDAERVAEAVSKATAKTAYNLAEMLCPLGRCVAPGIRCQFHERQHREHGVRRAFGTPTASDEISQARGSDKVHPAIGVTRRVSSSRRSRRPAIGCEGSSRAMFNNSATLSRPDLSCPARMRPRTTSAKR